MIRKLIRQMLTAQVFAALTVSSCLLIDNIMTGRFLGVEALAAYQYSSPVLMVVGSFGALMTAGVQVTCSQSLGQGDQEETNRGYSSAVVLGLSVAAALVLLVVLLRSPLAAAMGAARNEDVFVMTKDYMLGFVLGAPGSIGALLLVPFMQMAGQTTLVIIAVLGMTVADIGLDLLNVHVLHWGMYGMGLASSLSYYLAVLIGSFYFFSKKSVFRFSFRQAQWKKMLEIMKNGVPTIIAMVAPILLVFLMNQVFQGVGGEPVVAAFSVMSSIGSASSCINTGIGGVTLTLAGIFYQEEDRTALKELVRTMMRYSIWLGLAVGGLLWILAPTLVPLFIPEAGTAQETAILGVRLYGAGLIPACMMGCLKNLYQSCGQVRLMEGISVVEGMVLPFIAGLLMSLVLKTTGALLYFAIGECLAVLAMGWWIRKKSGKLPWQDGAYLLLQRDWGVTEENLREWNIRTVEEVARAAEEANAFCLARGQSPRAANRMAVCIEEMASNTVTHGFAKEKKEHHLSVRLLNKEDRWVLRFRDDCRAFDPVHYVPGADQEKTLGLRLVMGLADEIRYTYSLNLNNLTLIFGNRGKALEEKQK